MVQPSAIDAILKIAGQLSNAASTSFRDDPTSSASLTLSLRQIVRVARHVSACTGTTPVPADIPADVATVITESIKEIMLLQFLPEPVRHVIQKVLASVLPQASMVTAHDSGEAVSYKPVVDGNDLTIGGLTYTRTVPTHPELVPAPLFFDIPR